MRQEKLEEKVRDLFERQDFEISKDGNVLKAEKEDQHLVLKVFSSEDYVAERIFGQISEGEKVFVDEGLEEVEESVEEVSVIREDEEDEEYDLPSYELIGDVAVINELTVDEDEAVEGIQEHHPSVKTILLKEEPLQGEFRVGDYRRLYGKETDTIHKEFGCRFKVDPTKVYYSERFSTERKRVIDQIKDGERVLVMFAGVGPFSIMAAKLAEPERVVAVEKNPIAADYLKQNIELNNFAGVVEGIEGDVKEIVPKLGCDFDRVIMPLPEKAEDFLDVAEEVLVEGGVCHLYTFASADEELCFDGFEVLNKTVTGDRNPAVSRVCLDMKKL